MTGRIPFGLLTLLTVLVCAPIQAQDQMGPPPGYGAQPDPEYGVQPAGFHALQDGVGSYHGIPLGYQRKAANRMPGPPPQTTYEQLPDDLGFRDEDTQFGKMLTETFRHAWFRAEYLQWTISRPGSVILGEQTSDGVASINNTFTGGPPNVPIQSGVQFVQTVNTISGTAQTPALDGLTIQNSNGFRGTFGLQAPVGAFEFSAFVLATNTSTFDGNSLIQPEIIANPAVTIGNTAGQTGPPLGQNGLPATNGQVATFISQAMLTNNLATPFASTTFINYDVSYQARMTTSAWGTEGNYVMDSADPNSPFQLRPEFGFRYFNLRDRLDQSGQYNQPSVSDPTLTTVVNRAINSSAINNLFGPQIGTRAEFTYSRFVLGVEPKLMLGINSYQAGLNTLNVLSSTDPGQSLLSRGTTFSPMVDLKGYANVALSKCCSAYVAYNYIWAGNVTRSYQDIVYNKNAITNNSDFSIQKQLTNISLQGISMGFEFRY